MEIQTFCDYFSLHQEHSQHQTICDLEITTDVNGQVVNKRRVPKNIDLGNGSSVRIFSDGTRTSFSGNPSRAGRLENFSGVSLDAGKTIANQIMSDNGLPEFTKGAKFTQIDITANLAAGKHLRTYLRALQCHAFGRLETTIDNGNVYFGKYSRHRQGRFYDKGKELREKHVPQHKGDAKNYLIQLADWCDTNGVVRNELKFLRALERLNVRDWESATHEKLEQMFNKEIKPMTKLEVIALDDVPMPYRATLALYMAGADLSEAMHPQTLKLHKRELKKTRLQHQR